MNRQKGFTLVEVLLIVLIAMIVGFGGYYVWSQNQDETVQQQDNEQTQEVAEDVNTVPEGWTLYEGEGFSFIYPSSWDNLEDLPDDWRPAVLDPADGYEVGGGFGPTISYSTSESKWRITELGRYPGGREVGDEFDLHSRTSDSDVTVYDYTDGDGPFSLTKLLFVSGDKMVKIELPPACPECDSASTYDRSEIIEFSEQISKSVKVESEF